MIADIKKVGTNYQAIFSRKLLHSVEDVWTMFTENEKLKQWFDELCVGKLREGGYFKLRI
ncbi:hypothetical protein GMD78_18080 [Ornithinibacillus sp. L9]|uniref:Activator of Hsp90 ATPase homologue 1/2-like C-terminal domain-containing protein n=1 Tax=Ornithinibacillus caprae TaxID=2678566 RepID=A0A6N8FNB0_9BACI|nr:SRPBCC domain-containing protein [Ornithinibacillus caprae]MUK90286.1 hypothetical protein [Ornithinibacillus caprae]